MKPEKGEPVGRSTPRFDQDIVFANIERRHDLTRSLLFQKSQPSRHNFAQAWKAIPGYGRYGEKWKLLIVR